MLETVTSLTCVEEEIPLLLRNRNVPLDDSYVSALSAASHAQLVFTSPLMLELLRWVIRNRPILIRKLMRNADYETKGGEVLTRIASHAPEDLAKKIIRHAEDELIHGRLLQEA